VQPLEQDIIAKTQVQDGKLVTGLVKNGNMNTSKLQQIVRKIISEKKLCKKGKAYRERKMKPKNKGGGGEKHSAYLSARSSKLCEGQIDEEQLREIIRENLRDWFKEKWVRIDTQGNITGDCGTMKKGKATTRCLPQAKAQSLSQSERKSTVAKKIAGGKKGKQFVKNTKKAEYKK
jgi:hypothetical protein